MSANAGKCLVGIDGCPVPCTKKTMDHAGLPLTDYIMVTELGFEKGAYSGTIDKEALKKVKAQVKQQISLPK